MITTSMPSRPLDVLSRRVHLVIVSALMASAALLAVPAAQASTPLIKPLMATPDAGQPGDQIPVELVAFNSGGVGVPAGGQVRLELTTSPEIALPAEPPEFKTSDDHFPVTEKQCEMAAHTMSCLLSFAEGLPSGMSIDYVSHTFKVAVEPLASGTATVRFTVSSAGFPETANGRDIAIGPLPPYGISAWEGSLRQEGGGAQRQAASAPAAFENELRPVNGVQLVGGVEQVLRPEEQLKDAVAHLPPGIVGNPLAVRRCAFSALINVECPLDSQVGVFQGSFWGIPQLIPIYNMEPAVGKPAEFAFVFFGVVVPFFADLRQGDYGIDVDNVDISTTLVLTSAKLEFWGVPADPSHNGLRGTCLEGLQKVGSRPGGNGESCPSPAQRISFLRTPTRCPASPLPVGVSIDTYQHPDVKHEASYDLPSPTDCGRVPFDPSLSADTTSPDAETSSGLHVVVETPNPGLTNPDAISESDVKGVKVALPQGVTINPSQAEGLGVCTQAQYESSELSFHPNGKGCPSDSKIGTVAVHTPLLEETLPGNVYISKPYDNPFGSLLAIYVVVEEPMRGILIKLAGKVETDETTGRIVTTFDDLPQQPFSRFEFDFREGARAPLVTPSTCGTYTTESTFTPWSDPSRAVVSKSSFQIEHGIGGGPCPPEGTPSFKPGFSAGSINNNAGSFSPFDMRLTRNDGEQDMTRFSSVLPPGVLGKLAGVAKCPEAAIAAAKAKTGLQEIASPSCPVNSQIGRSIVGAGVGSVLTYIPGKLYLGGPFNGDPLSVIAITPAVAGPFDVGTVVVHEALTLNPKTAEVEVDGSASDPIPHILKGIPAKVRDLRVYVDRPDFILNPTSCDPSQTSATLFGGGGNAFSTLDDVPVSLADRFQAASCASLGFKPHLGLKLKGGTRRGAFPALTATYRPRKGDANVKGLLVTLPRSAFLEQGHIRTICTRVQFGAKACPQGSVYGHIKAWTPLLYEPLEGPVYLRSSNHKLPDLVFDLHGLVDVEVATRIDSFHGGIRATVQDAPDAPLTKVVLRMQGAKKGLVVNSRNLCASVHRANVEFEGQNGKTANAKPVLTPDCGGKRKHKRNR